MSDNAFAGMRTFQVVSRGRRFEHFSDFFEDIDFDVSSEQALLGKADERGQTLELLFLVDEGQQSENEVFLDAS